MLDVHVTAHSNRGNVWSSSRHELSWSGWFRRLTRDTSVITTNRKYRPTDDHLDRFVLPKKQRCSDWNIEIQPELSIT